MHACNDSVGEGAAGGTLRGKVADSATTSTSWNCGTEGRCFCLFSFCIPYYLMNITSHIPCLAVPLSESFQDERPRDSLLFTKVIITRHRQSGSAKVRRAWHWQAQDLLRFFSSLYIFSVKFKIYPIPSMSQCECGRLWDASQCVSYALLSPTRYRT